MKNNIGRLIVATLALLFSCHSTYGASGDWTGDTDATWANTGNWSETPVPGAGDTATFNTTPATGNGTTTPVTVAGGISVGQIVFDTADAGAYTIGTTSGGPINLTSNYGSVEITGTVVNTQTVNAPLTIDSGASNYFFINNSTSAASLNLGGSISGTVATGSQTIIFGGSNTTATNTASGVIQDGGNGGNLGVQIGGGIWALTNANTYTGGTTLNNYQAQLIVGANTSLGSGTVVLNSGAFAASNAVTLNNTIVDTGNPSINGSSDITFTGSFTNSGGNQQLTVNNTGTTTFSGNTMYLSEAAGMGRTLTMNGSGAIVIDDVISDYNGSGLSGNLSYSGTGSLVLAGNNTFTGLATFGNGNNPQTYGTVTISGNNTAATGGVQLNNGFLQLDSATALGSGTFTIVNGYIDNITGAPLTETNNPAISLASVTFLGSNSLDLGSGAVSFNGANTGYYNQDTITLGNVNNTSLSFDGVAGNDSPNGLYLTVNGRTGVTGTALVFNNGFNLANNATTASVTDTFSGSGNITINDGVSDGGGAYGNVLQYEGTGVLTLGSAGTYSGGTYLNSGTIVLGNNAAMGTGQFYGYNSTLEASTALTNVANDFTDEGDLTIAGSNDITVTGTFTADAGNNRTLTVNNTGTTTLAGNVYLSNSAGTGRTFTINGSGNLVINGVVADYDGAGSSSSIYYAGTPGATLTMTKDNTYSGGTTVESGTLKTALSTSGTPFGTGGLALVDGTVDFAPGGSGSSIAYNVSGNSFTYGSGTIVLDQGSNNSLTVTLGNGTPSRVNNIAGLLIVAPSVPGALGTTEGLLFGSAPTVTNGMINASIVSVGATTAGMGDFLTYGGNGLAVASYTNHAGDFTTTADEIANVTANANVTTTNNIRGLLVQDGVTATLGGTLNFDGSGAGVILNGGTIAGGNINISNGSETDFYAFNAPSTIDSTITISSGGNGTSMVVGGTQTLTLNGGLHLNNGDGQVYVTSGGLTIAGVTSANTNFTVNGGTLNLNSSYDNTNGTITVGGFTTSVLTTNAANAISGSSALTINGGNVTLNSANNYTGATLVGSQNSFDGNLNLNATGAINGSAITLVQNGGGTLNANAVNALAGATSITIDFNPNNSNFGTVNINQSQNFTGGITLNGGVVNITGSGTLTGSNIVNNAGTVNLETAGAISQGTLYMTGGALNETVADAISGTAGLTVYGIDPVSISMANNYTGATTIIGGSNPYTLAGTSSAGGTMAGVTLDFSQANSPLTNIINNGISHADIASGSTLVMGGGSLNVIGKNNTANSQEFNGLDLTGGQNYIAVVKGLGGSASTDLILNGITRSTGAVLNFGSGPNTNVSNSPAGTITTTSTNFDGGTILGGWATYGGNTWATVGASGVITGLASTAYTTFAPTNLQGKDVEAGSSVGLNTDATSINSLRFSNDAGGSLIGFANNLVIATGGILSTTSNGNTIASSTDGLGSVGTLTSGNGQDLIVTVNGNGALEIDANIVDNGSTSIGLTLAGSGNGGLILGGTNTFTGALTIDSGTVQLASTTALNSAGVAVVFAMNGVQGGTLDLNGNNATVTNVSDNTGTNRLNGGPDFTNSNTGAAATLTIANNANDTFDGGIQNASGATLNLVKTGTGTLDLTANARSGNGGLNLSYDGTTEIDGGKLYLGITNGTNLDGTTSLLVNAGASIGSIGGYNNTIGNGSTFLATVVGGGTIDMTDGIAGGSLAFSATAGNTSLVIGGTAGNASAISLDVGNGTADEIILGNGRNTQNNINVGAGGFLVNLVGVGGLNGNTQTILSTSGFDVASNISTFTGNVGAGTTILLGITSGNFGGYTVALQGSGNDLNITETANTLTPNAALYYSGNNSVGGTVAGGTSAWNSFTGGNANNSNFAYTGTTGADSNQEVNSSVNLHFGTAPTNSTALANYTNNTLGADTTINSLTYDSGVNSDITTSGDNNLTILSASGITDLAGDGTDPGTGGTQTIATNQLTMGSSQTWTVALSANLVVNSSITDDANNYSLTKTGNGALTLGGANVYTGGTNVNQGTLYANGASSTGSGLVTVSGTGTLSGLGTIRPTDGTSSSIGVLVNAGGTLAPGGAQSVGYEGVPGTVANGNLTIDTSHFLGTTGLSLSSEAGLTFALGAGGSSSELVVGATTVVFNDNVVTINDLVGANLAGEYVLIAGNGTNFEGLTYGPETVYGELITSGLSLASLTPGENFFSDYYGPSELYLVGNDIEVEVIPEPGTWALMLGGFALLIFVQRRKRRTAAAMLR